jgi:predicted small lipoprotein YifL
MRYSLTVMLIAALTAGSLAGCSEKAPRSIPSGEQAYNNDHGESLLRERTRQQGESSRGNY